MLAETGEPRLVAVREVDVLARLEPVRQLRVGLEEERDDRLLVLERPRPLPLAFGFGADAVAGHDEQHALAGSQRPYELFVPIDAGLQATSIQPNVDRRRSGGELIGEF